MYEDELRVAERLRKSDLAVRSFDKKETEKKTPDFRVSGGGSDEVLFFCEVKSISEDLWLERQLDDAPAGELAGGLRNDPVYNRLTDDIHQAIKQFDSVNPGVSKPNVLAFVNHDIHCGIVDLIGVLTGNVVTSDGEAIPILRHFSEGRIREEKKRIHMYIWLDDFKGEERLFGQTDEGHHLLLCRCFQIDPASIKQLKKVI